ncbi:uncharacterized protein RAG0_14984 [Rhynchosporium agropyri]|uniref:Uncharacterized protein n=1 Tax=Rhynchosporium agropyri TaxID=914238 RepID=A0A1E1LJ79_9HELO|nr:uncharacterized protein RAG0_14984 [Rhynchosporium agropyri]
MVVIRRKVRENRKSSDEYDAETGISTVWFHHASKDPYRVVAGLDYACPWPYDTDKPVSSNTKTVIDLIRLDYEKVLSRHGITFQDEELQSLSRRDHNDYTDTLLLMSLDDDVSKWCDAADEIQTMIDEAFRAYTPQIIPGGPSVYSDYESGSDSRFVFENKAYPIRVELRNPLNFYCDRTGMRRLCANGEQGTLALEKTQDIVMDKAELLCGKENISSVSWNLRVRVALVHPVDGIPTVMIGVKPRARKNWAAIEEEMCKAIEGVLDEEDTEVTVEIGPGWIQQGIYLDPKLLN